MAKHTVSVPSVQPKSGTLVGDIPPSPYLGPTMPVAPGSRYVPPPEHVRHVGPLPDWLSSEKGKQRQRELMRRLERHERGLDRGGKGGVE